MCLFWTTSTYAKEDIFSPAPQARIITLIDGLNIGNVNAISQSSQGLIWLGTDEGLIRYDGYNATRFVNILGDSQSLSHNKVMSIVEDKDDNLWISTYGGGLNKFTPHNEQFEKISLRLSPSDRTLTDFLYSLTLDRQNMLWIGSDSGLKRFDISNNTPLPLPPAMTNLPSTVITTTMLDSNQHLWVASQQDSVFKYDSKRLIKYANQARSGLHSHQIHQIIEGPQGHIWLGSSEGLHRFIAENNQFERFVPSYDSAFAIPDNNINALAFDHKGQLWLGTQTTGVHKFTPDNLQFNQITGDKDIYQQFNRKYINAIFKDAQGSLWFATEHGVIFVAKTALDFKYLTNKAANLMITDIEPLHDDKIAFAGNYQYYDLDINSHTVTGHMINENRLYRITTDNKDALWLATLGQGLQQFSLSTHTLTQIEHAKPQYTQAPVTGIFDSYLDKNQQLWLLPFPDLPDLAGGIIHYNQQNNQFETYLSSPFISDILQIDNNQLLLCSDSVGLITLNTNSKVATRWQQTIPSTPRRIFTLFKDSQQNLWLGTRGQGLALFNSNTQSFEFFTTEHGLLSNDIYSITEDVERNLWLGNANGVTRFNPNTKQVLNLEKQDGLLFSSFYKRASAASAGKILLGSHQGIVTIDPKDFAANEDKTLSNQPQVFISDFKVFNQSVSWKNSNDDTPLNQPIGFTDKLVLSHQDYMFSFNFSAAEYVRPDKIKFAYKMQGLDKQWLYTNASNRVASFTTLSPGDYVFQVKATDRHGNWTEQTASIQVTIKPPWWLSIQAYLFYLLASLACVYLFINLRTKKLVSRALDLERSVALRTQELKNSRDQVTDLLAQKQQLFASVSHEFRTPLTLILSPIEHLLGSSKGQHIQKELSLIKRNGRRLLRMVDQLLEFAKLELHDDSQMEQVSLRQTLDIIMSSFESLVKSKNIGLSVNHYDDVVLNMLPDSLNKILINILSNAFKYSPENSQIHVQVNNHMAQVEIAISDTGIGISENDLEAVFQRFNRAIHDHGEAVPGAGIGLALVKELVEANEGQITLSSVLRKGSTFTVVLPIIGSEQAHLPNDDSNKQALINEHLNLEIDSVASNENDKLQSTSVLPDNDESRKTVLIVDDNPDLRYLLHQQLDSHYHCLLAENGQIGVDIAREQLPDLVISDVMMPVMDGYQLTRELKSNELTSHIPIILLTAKGSMESRLKGLQLLVDDYLAKPFNIEELTLRIHNILTIRDIVKQRFKQVIDEVDPQSKMVQLGVNDVEQSFIKRVNRQLGMQHTDAEFNAKALSRELGVSERQLQRKLKAQFDLGFPELLRNYRLNQALEMLKSGQRVSQIYHNVGFSSHSYFSSCFKAKFGQTPKEFQLAL